MRELYRPVTTSILIVCFAWMAQAKSKSAICHELFEGFQQLPGSRLLLMDHARALNLPYAYGNSLNVPDAITQSEYLMQKAQLYWARAFLRYYPNSLSIRRAIILKEARYFQRLGIPLRVCRWKDAGDRTERGYRIQFLPGYPHLSRQSFIAEYLYRQEEPIEFAIDASVVLSESTGGIFEDLLGEKTLVAELDNPRWVPAAQSKLVLGISQSLIALEHELYHMFQYLERLKGGALLSSAWPRHVVHVPFEARSRMPAILHEAYQLEEIGALLATALTLRAALASKNPDWIAGHTTQRTLDPEQKVKKDAIAAARGAYQMAQLALEFYQHPPATGGIDIRPNLEADYPGLMQAPGRFDYLESIEWIPQAQIQMETKLGVEWVQSYLEFFLKNPNLLRD